MRKALRAKKGTLKTLLIASGFAVAAFFAATCREAPVVPTDLPGTLSQGDCKVTVAPLFATPAASDATVTVTMTANRTTCGWTASTATAWLKVPANNKGTGSGSVTFTIDAPNTGTARKGTIEVSLNGSSQRVDVDVQNQAAACRFTLTGDVDAVFPATGGSGQINVAVTQGADCGWTVTTTDAFLSIVGPASGTGAGVVKFDVQASTLATTRVGALSIAGQAIRVTQEGTPAPGCSYSVAPPSLTGNVAASGASLPFTVSAAAGCDWTATASQAWLTVNPTTGSGAGTVNVAAAANLGSGARTAQLLIAGQAIPVTQDGACSFTVTPSASQVLVATEGVPLSYSVTAPQNCAWTASSDAHWITLAPAGGPGGGAPQPVTATVAANPTGAERQGNITIAGVAISVRQPGLVCSYSIDWGGVSGQLPSYAQTFNIGVTAPAGCGWSASSTALWITFPDPSGNGSGSISLEVAANNSGISPERSAIASVAGNTRLIIQAGTNQSCDEINPPCAYSTSSMSFAAAGGPQMFSVNGPPNVIAGPMSKDVGWIAFTGGTGGVFLTPGSVTVSVTANATGQSRVGHITSPNVPGSITVTQGP